MTIKKSATEKLKFNAKTHTYKIGKKKLTSVTTFLKEFFPEFDAKTLARKLASLPWAKAQKKGVKYWIGQWKKDTEAGTETHRQIEAYINGEIDLLEVEDVKARWAINYFDSLMDKPLTVTAETEKQVFSEGLGLAGTIDLFIEEVDTVRLIDWKTSKELDKVYEENTNEVTGHLPNNKLSRYTLQLAIYAYIVEKELGWAVKNLDLVHLKEDKFEVHSILYDDGLKKIVEEMLVSSGRTKKHGKEKD